MLKRKIYKYAIEYFPSLFFKINHYRLHKKFGSHAYWANLTHPQTFNEKLLSAKLNKEYEKLGHLVDKELVKEYVKGKLGENVIIPTIAVFHNANNFSLDALHFPCILKPTHSSSRVLKINDRKQYTENEIKDYIKPWFSINHYESSGEPQYKHLNPKVIAEKMLGDFGSSLYDYKVFCFHGNPEFIQVDVDRGTKHTRVFYDLNWEKQDFTIKYPLYNGELEKPELLYKVLEYSRLLSCKFPFARVDFYIDNGRLYFGEITFHPESGYGPFTTYKHDLKLGQLL